MKGFLILVGLVGAAIYGVLIFTHDALTDGKTENTRIGQVQPIVPSTHLSSWDAYLPTRSQRQNPERQKLSTTFMQKGLAIAIV
jgi:hypothetical protein